MGRAIGEIAVERGHKIVAAIDIGDSEVFTSEALRSADVAIEFTTPSSAFDNCQRCFSAGLAVVSGTTGWTERLSEIRKQCDEEGKTFFYSSNFSIGVNIFFALNRHLASLMNNFPEYDVSMKEVHHIHKLDAPSGTAITLVEGIIENLERKTGWSLALEGASSSASASSVGSKVEITALREGETPGFHEVRYTSLIDEITISHNAKSRVGFALGAVLAAEYTARNKGFLTMKDMLKI